MRILSQEWQLRPGEFLRLSPGILMDRWEDERGEDCRFIRDPGFSEDQDPDPEFAGMRFEDIDREIWEYEREVRAYEDEWRRMQAKGF